MEIAEGAGSILPNAVRHAVEDVLSARFGGRVRVSAERQFRPSSVFRCTLLQTIPSTAPETVIVRIPREGTPRSGRTGLQKERAALGCLAEIGSSLAPRFLACGGTAGFLVTEDLGDHPSLMDVLLGPDSEAARQGTIAFARGLGRLHAQTAGRPESLPADLSVVQVPVTEHWHQVRDAVARLGLPMPRWVDGDVEEITRFLAEPGACLTMSNGDASVVNCKIAGGEARFFDFEDACFRHALVDAAVLRYPYPTGGPPWRLPHEVAIQAEAAYRAELASACPMTQDDDYYERGLGDPPAGAAADGGRGA